MSYTVSRNYCVIFFSLILGVLPVAGYSPISKGLIKHIRYLLLPAFALSFSQSALLIRLTRSSMIDVLEENLPAEKAQIFKLDMLLSKVYNIKKDTH